MAYTPFQDGTQKFGISESPIDINSVFYILESFNRTQPTTVPEIKDQNGIPIGQVIIPQVMTATAVLQLAAANTAVPQVTQLANIDGADWIINEVGEAYTQGEYAKVNISLRMKINA